jgi:hypothetical protein
MFNVPTSRHLHLDIYGFFHFFFKYAPYFNSKPLFLGQPSVQDSDLRKLNGCIRFFVRTLNGHAHKTQSGPRLAREDKVDLQKKGTRARAGKPNKSTRFTYAV